MALADANQELIVNLDWEPAEGVRTDELRATWSRLQLRVGDAVLTQVQDSGSGAVRDSIYVPLYPLAEWVAYNWWYLRSDARPGYLPRWDWAFRNGLRKPRERSAWLTHHNLRAVGEGFAWPDLTILPSDGFTRLAWYGDTANRADSKVRFLSTGEAIVDAASIGRTMSSVVEAVIARLEDSGIVNTPLHEEWRSIQRLDPDEVEFCDAAARLGLDPFEVPDSVSDLIVQSSTELEGQLFDDFLGAADASKIRDDLEWIASSSEVIRSSEAKTRLETVLEVQTVPPSRSWELGLRNAQSMRHELGLAVDERVDLTDWIAVERVPRVDRGLAGLGGRSRSAAYVLALGDSRSEEANRFSAARALWRFARAAQTPERFLITSSRAPIQQAERAFAAEFLAPAEGILGFLAEDDGAPAAIEEISVASQHFGVNEAVVSYQIMNQLDRNVEDPSLPMDQYS